MNVELALHTDKNMNILRRPPYLIVAKSSPPADTYLEHIRPH